MSGGDFIEVYDGALDAATCAELIARFEASGEATRGATGGGVDTQLKNSWDIHISGRAQWADAERALNAAMMSGLMRYLRRYPYTVLAPLTLRMPDANGASVRLDAERLCALPDNLLQALIRKVLRPGAINLQKYIADEGGYPYWHCELYPKANDAAGETLHRTLLWTIYLNDGFAEGETEFLYQQRKIVPKTGSLLIAPAAFTHTHRGNMPQGGGRGGIVGSIIGAYILMIIVNILLVLNVSAYYSTVVEGCILILAVLASSISRHSRAAKHLRAGFVRFQAWRKGMLPRQVSGASQRLTLPGIEAKPHKTPTPSFLVRNAESIRYALPAYVCFLIVLVVTELTVGRALTSWSYFNSIVVLSSFLLILALGQGSVILTGGLDLSVPWTIALAGILLAGMVNGQNGPMIYALPLVLLVGCLVGLANGIGIAIFGISPIVMTLAMNGILQGLALLYSQGTPAGFSSPLMRWFMTDKSGVVTPVVVFILLFVIAAVVLHRRTPFGRRLYGLGNGEKVAALSGINVDRTIMLVYALSGFCAALVGCMLTGFSGQASLGMGDEYMLPSIAVVVVGGTLITGGRGSYLGMVGGVLLLTALQTLLAGTMLPYATRIIIFGLVVLAAVIALRERNH